MEKKCGFGFETAIELLHEENLLDEIDHPRRKNQKIFVIEVNGYAYAIPFVIEKNDTVFLKTMFPSRKLTKDYLNGKK